MRPVILAIFFTLIVYCKATYIPTKLGLGYNIPGLEYSVPAVSRVVAQQVAVPSAGYKTVTLVKAAPAASVASVAPVAHATSMASVAPVEIDRHRIVYDGGVAYIMVDAGYGGSYVDNSEFSVSPKLGYGSATSVIEKITYPLKK